jgi:hypothetical protein
VLSELGARGEDGHSLPRKRVDALREGLDDRARDLELAGMRA